MIDFNDWYRSRKALEVLSKNIGKTIKQYQLHRLCKKGIIATFKLSKSIMLYSKEQIDSLDELPDSKAQQRREVLKLIELQGCSISFLRKVPRDKRS